LLTFVKCYLQQIRNSNVSKGNVLASFQQSKIVDRNFLNLFPLHSQIINEASRSSEIYDRN